MKRHVLFVQGGGETTHDEWDNKLVDSLKRALGDGYELHYPRMPNEGDPSFARWSAALSTEFARLTDGAVLVGHSIGATILINTLADRTPPFTPAGLFLIAAPFVGDGGWPSDEIAPMADLGARLPRALPIYLYHGDADDTAPIAHAALYEQALPQARIRRLPGRDHQLNDNLSEAAADIRALLG